MSERACAEKRRDDWNKEDNLQAKTHETHGSAHPLIAERAVQGILIVSGLPQVEDHLFAVEVLTEFLARKSEEL
jgi:uncharacterized protein (UPF0303 family)